MPIAELLKARENINVKSLVTELPKVSFDFERDIPPEFKEKMIQCMYYPNSYDGGLSILPIATKTLFPNEDFSNDEWVVWDMMKRALDTDAGLNRQIASPFNYSNKLANAKLAFPKKIAEYKIDYDLVNKALDELGQPLEYTDGTHETFIGNYIEKARITKILLPKKASK